MNKNRAFELLDTFYEAGGNFIDAANNCQNEQSEEWIGEWIQSRRLRDQIVIATKFIKSDKSIKQVKVTLPTTVVITSVVYM
ncbi:AGA_1a_G0017650.mRNA.1.CDS.1 [Saccharomyces cerevisiae]|nr:AGA_1a_G0017650.mRNA.1.CDS.1 [Saccharomyces cerevisiae]CAI6649850.1 AGA_1a_G0017650.mRNA.1.CDS.1 [Saccharomyces cerevisiae]